MLFWILGGYFAFAGFMMYVLIMGQSRYHRDGYVGALARWLQNAPSQIGRLFCMVLACGNREKGRTRWSACEERVMMKRHPTLMIFYLGIMAASYWAFFTYVYPRLHPSDIARPFSILMSVMAIVIYFKACWTNPGVVLTKEQLAKASAEDKEKNRRNNAKWKADGELFQLQAADCTTCAVPKPPRSKHCRVCGHCVRRYDHHCGWLNQDVGQGNMVWFHAFLVFHVFISTYYVVWCVQVLFNWITENRLWGAAYVGADGTRHVASYHVIFMYTLAHHPAIIALAFFATLVALMLFFFWISHFKNAIRNLTSNEVYKIDEYKELLLHDLAERKKRKAENKSLPGDDVARPKDEKDVAQMVKDAHDAFSLGSWWLNLFDSYGWIKDPAEVRQKWLDRKKKPLKSESNGTQAKGKGGGKKAE